MATDKPDISSAAQYPPVSHPDKSKEPFALAGLWDTWKTPDGTILESFAVITVEPNEFMRRIHDRMPLILRPEDESAWLDCAANPFDKVAQLVTHYPSYLMDARF